MTKRGPGRPPLPEPKCKRVTIALTEQQHRALLEAARESGKPPSVVAGETVARWLWGRA